MRSSEPGPVLLHGPRCLEPLGPGLLPLPAVARGAPGDAPLHPVLVKLLRVVPRQQEARHFVRRCVHSEEELVDQGRQRAAEERGHPVELKYNMAKG